MKHLSDDWILLRINCSSGWACLGWIQKFSIGTPPECPTHSQAPGLWKYGGGSLLLFLQQINPPLKLTVMHLSTYKNLGFTLAVLLIKDLNCDYTNVYVEYVKSQGTKN